MEAVCHKKFAIDGVEPESEMMQPKESTMAEMVLTINHFTTYAKVSEWMEEKMEEILMEVNGLACRGRSKILRIVGPGWCRRRNGLDS